MVGCQSKTTANLVSDKDNGLHIFTQGRDSINLELLHEDYPQGLDGYLYVLPNRKEIYICLRNEEIVSIIGIPFPLSLHKKVTCLISCFYKSQPSIKPLLGSSASLG